MKSIKKILRENIYVTLIVSFILLAFIIFLIIKVVYPIWVIDTLLEMKPNFLEVEKQLKVSSFGDMYGALNTFFAGLAFVGASMAIFLQTYLYRHDRAIAKQEKEDEERQLLYYIWFRLDNIISEADGTLRTADNFIEKMRIEEFYENRNKIDYGYDDDAKMLKAIEQLKDVDVERNHLIYLKYLNDEALIRLLEFIPKYLNKLKLHIFYLNDSLTKKPKTEYFNELKHELRIFLDCVVSSKELPFILGKSTDSIKLYVSENIVSSDNGVISFNKLQEVGRTVFDFIDSEGKPIYFRFEKLHRMKEKLSYTECYFFEERYQNWIEKQSDIKEDAAFVRRALNVLRLECKIPQKV